MLIQVEQMAQLVVRQASRTIAEYGIEKPFEFQLGISISKVVAADLFVQKCVEGQQGWDLRRSMAFAALGGFYSGGFQYWLFVNKFTKWYPSTASFTQRSVMDKLRDTRGTRDMMAQIAIRNFVCCPLFYFPSFYFFQELVTGQPTPRPLPTPKLHQQASPELLLPPLWTAPPQLGDAVLQAGQRTFCKWQANITEDASKMIAFWIPLDLMIFAGPLWLRLPLIHAGSLVWTGILSALRGNAVNPVTQGTPAAMLTAPVQRTTGKTRREYWAAKLSRYGAVPFRTTQWHYAMVSPVHYATQ